MITQGDCLEGMRGLEAGSVPLVFADPPFNIGFKYDTYHDKRADYVEWCAAWLGEVARILTPTGTLWLAIGDDYAAELKIAAEATGLRLRSWVIWYFTFGQNNPGGFTRSHTHLLHFVKGEGFTFNAAAVKVPSARQTVYKDKRAKAGGRLPDNTWILRPAGFSEGEDTWHVPRLNGNAKERLGWHPCQMPETVLERIILVSSNPGDMVVDPFAGSGTSLAVALRLGRRARGWELSAEYARKGNERLA